MKKAFKKTVALLLAVVLLCGIMPVASRAVSSYTISVNDETAGSAYVNAGETVKLKVTVDGAAFNGMEAVLVYNSRLLRLESAEGVAVKNSDDDGKLELYTLRHEPYEAGSCVAELVFTALGDKEEKTASFEFKAGATAGDYAAFERGDAISAAIIGDEVVIKPHRVIKPDLFWGNSGVEHNGTYTFGVNDAGYSYGIPTASMDGHPVEVVQRAANRWHIENVSGNIVIADPRPGQEYSVTFDADGGIENLPVNGTVSGGEDYEFIVPTLKGYIIGVEVLINGTEFDAEIIDGKVTIPGEVIVGNVTVYFTKVSDNDCSGDEHIFEEPTYKWSSDNATCYAIRICECGMKKEEEIAVSTSEAGDEETTYTAVFENPAFETQVKTVKNSEDDGEDEEETITVSFRLIGDGIHDDGAEGHDKYVTWIPTGRYTVERGATVFDVLIMALSENGLGYETKNNYYISAIQAPEVLGGFWLYDGNNGPISGWMYTVGGTHPQVTMAAYELEDRESIIVHYCDDFTLEESPGAPYYQRWLEAADVPPSADDEDDSKEDEEGSGSGVIITPEVSVSGDKATANVGASEINGALEEAKKDEAITGVTITPSVEQNVNEVEVTIPKTSVGEVADNDLSISVETEIADVKLSAKALEDISSKSGNTVAVSAEKTTDSTIVVKVSVDGKTIDKVNGGIVVTVPAEDTNKVLVIVAEDGTETIVKKSAADTDGISALIEGSATVKLVEGKKIFDDVDEHWGKNAIEFSANRELFNGVADGVFAPDVTMTRAMLVTVLFRLEGEPGHEGHDHGFEDVEHDEWYSDAIAWANDFGIVEGHSDTSFDPHGEVTREQMAVILHRYAKYLEMSTHHKGDLSEFDDHHETSDWAREGKEWAVGAGIIEGKNNNKLDPTGNATRAEVATVLERLIKLMLK